MPRKACIDAPGALHHIIVRGIERRKIFIDDKDRNNFIGACTVYDIDKIAEKAAEIAAVSSKEIFQPGKQPAKVKARSLFCYWAVRELGYTMVELAQKLNISQPSVSVCVNRGERIVLENKLSIGV